jgi:hypothetical protein
MKEIKDLYLMVRDILLLDPNTRDSDKKLIYRVWQEQGFVTFKLGDLHFNSMDEFMNAAHPKSIIECRRKLQREQEQQIRDGVDIPDGKLLVADVEILNLRDQRNAEKGTHVYREQVTLFK